MPEKIENTVEGLSLGGEKMKVYKGKSISGGVAMGRICMYQKEKRPMKRYKIEDVNLELQRVKEALQRAAAQLELVYEQAVKEVGEANAAIFEIHRMMLEEGDYPDSIEEIITTQEVNAEYAVAVTAEKFLKMFSAMDDTYLQQRAADIEDISERLLQILQGQEKSPFDPGEAVILVAEDLSPGETVQLDKNKVLSLVILKGSSHSHTAILAKTMGIPTLMGVELSLDEIPEDQFAAVDGDEGCLYIEPTEEILQIMQEKIAIEREKKDLLKAFYGKEGITLDGQRMMLCANIDKLKDLDAVIEHDAEGIGLFRSEFLYLEKDTYPTEEEQFQVYKTVVETLAGKPVIIRTLDMGADKRADYFELPKEENPALGCRAIRISLSRPQIFKTQLRALLRAAAYGKLAIMYPMITSLSEIRQIKAMVEEVKNELKGKGVEYGNVEQGIMIETPGAAVISDLLAKEVDFFSIGTNDLTQYTLAIDRQNPALDAFYDVHHPAILRMIDLTVSNAHQAGIWCGICGELGGDLELIKLFLAMGVDELSLSFAKILPVRKIICETNVSECREEVRNTWL